MKNQVYDLLNRVLKKYWTDDAAIWHKVIISYLNIARLYIPTFQAIFTAILLLIQHYTPHNNN